MPDTISQAKRSWNMSRIRSRDTKPELAVRSVLHKNGFRFSLRRHDLPGKPDIVLVKHRTVIFVHGCFWHRHEGCKYAYLPKTRVAFWRRKFDANVRRDTLARDACQKLGWAYFVVWECEVREKTWLAALIRLIG